jgi:hypothetical protein
VKRRGVWRRRSFCVLGLVLGFGVPDAAAVLCLKKNRKITYRATPCTRRERTLTAAEIGAQGPPGAPGDPGGRHPAAPTVLNGALQRIGTFVDGRTIVASPIDGRALLVEVDAAGLLDRSPLLTLYYQGASCGGPAFMEDDAKHFLRFALRSGGTVYYAGDPLAATDNAYAAEERACPAGTPPNTPRGTCCTIGTFLRRAGPVQTFDAVVFGGPPFTLDP